MRHFSNFLAWAHRGGLAALVRNWWPAIAFLGIWLGQNIADKYQDREAAVSILNQREIAESTLRSEMFKALIGNLIPEKISADKLDPYLYNLFVKLLALNFHEHLEAKPLMLAAYESLISKKKRCMADATGEKEKNCAKVDQEMASLQFVSQQVIDRQLAVLEDAPLKDCFYRANGGQAEKFPISDLVEFEFHDVGNIRGGELALLADFLRQLDEASLSANFVFDADTLNLKRVIKGRVDNNYVANIQQFPSLLGRMDFSKVKDVATLRRALKKKISQGPNELVGLLLRAASPSGSFMGDNTDLNSGVVVNASGRKIALVPSVINQSVGFKVPSPDCGKVYNVEFFNFDWENKWAVVGVSEDPTFQHQNVQKRSIRAALRDFFQPGERAEHEQDNTYERPSKRPNIVMATQFDFPLTSSVLLNDGNRFVVFADQKDKTERVINVRLRWFPRNYIPPRERPSDYQKFRKNVPVLSGEPEHGWVSRIIQTFPGSPP